MTEVKFTPGPWAFKLGDICGPDDTDGDDLVIAAVGRSSGLRSAQYSIIKSGPAYEANARLIAAAPELLEALKSLVDQDYNVATGRGFDTSSLVAAIEAISKAESNQ